MNVIGLSADYGHEWRNNPIWGARERLDADDAQVMLKHQRPTLFLDMDDVLCLNHPYGGRHATLATPPPDLWTRLFHPPAVKVLNEVMCAHQPHVVITSSWLQFLDRDGVVQLFRHTALAAVADALHDAWDAPTLFGQTRLQAIERWLSQHYQGEAFVVVDDELSGTGLKGSVLDSRGRLVLCQVGVGLHQRHLGILLSALAGSPVDSDRRVSE